MEFSPLDDLRLLHDNSNPHLEFAGFWLRVVALLLDWIILFFLFAAGVSVFYVLILIGYGGDTSSDGGATRLVDWFNQNIAVYIFYAFSFFYFAYMESSLRQATFGKYWLGLRVTDMDGQKISFQTALIRRFAMIASGLLLYIGFLMVLFSQKKQALHDKIAKTLVVRTL